MVIEFGLVFQLDNQISYLYEEIINDKIVDGKRNSKYYSWN